MESKPTSEFVAGRFSEVKFTQNFDYTEIPKKKVSKEGHEEATILRVSTIASSFFSMPSTKTSQSLNGRVEPG
ncbi:MAG: hypothetical protein S4CHLAM20_10500 [Chlamydiia bacterium]|nr:hypothetical protein [Chlamydiia bacterium]